MIWPLTSRRVSVKSRTESAESFWLRKSTPNAKWLILSEKDSIGKTIRPGWLIFRKVVVSDFYQPRLELGTYLYWVRSQTEPLQKSHIRVFRCLLQKI